MSAEFNKLLLDISHAIDNLPVNSTTNKNIDIIYNTRADSAVALVYLYHLINNIEQCKTDILINLSELSVLRFHSKSRK